jgi:ferredoxin
MGIFSLAGLEKCAGHVYAAVERLTRGPRVARSESRMKVWIDQDLCTGDGLCEEIAPDVFTLLDDGLAYVKEGAKVFSEPGGAEGLANVPAGQEEAVIESAEECPGECIFIEVD